jgi:hypothetical protein
MASAAELDLIASLAGHGELNRDKDLRANGGASGEETDENKDDKMDRDRG